MMQFERLYPRRGYPGAVVTLTGARLLRLNQHAFAMLGRPERIAVDLAEVDGDLYGRLLPADPDTPSAYKASLAGGGAQISGHWFTSQTLARAPQRWATDDGTLRTSGDGIVFGPIRR